MKNFTLILCLNFGQIVLLKKQMYRVRTEAVGPIQKDKNLFHLEGVHAQYLTQTM